MPRTDHARCLFTVIPTNRDKPAVIHFEFIDNTLSVLKRPTRCVFVSLKKGIDQEQAEDLAVQLNRMVATMDVTEYALGERERDIF